MGYEYVGIGKVENISRKKEKSQVKIRDEENTED